MQRKMLQSLIGWKQAKSRKPFILKGVRQVGKTYLLKEFGVNYFPQYHYCNFEKEPELKNIFEKDLLPKRIITELSFFFGTTINIQEDLLIFDEIQEAPRALTSLKYFYEEYPDAYITAAGSLLGLHLNGTSFPVGKVTFETLRPLSFEEFLHANEDKAFEIVQGFNGKDAIPEIVHKHLWEQLLRYFITGGLPEVVLEYCKCKDDLFTACTVVRKKQADLIQSYYADIAKHSGKINSMHIDRVFQAVPSQLSQVQDSSTSRFMFKGVIPGVTHYDRLSGAIDWLEATGLVVKVMLTNNGQIPFKAYTKENFFKLFVFDVGILGCMLDLPPKSILDQDYGSYKGYFAENFVLEELLTSGKEQLFSWQERNLELEFLLEIEGNVVPLEVKSGSIIKTTSLNRFTEKYHPAHEVVVSGRPFFKEKRRLCCPLYFAGKIQKIISTLFTA